MTEEGETVSTQPTLAELLESHRDERHVIVLHDYPDPDAIASAYTQQLISARFGIEATILHTGRISHRQNVALVKILGIELTLYKEDTDLSAYDGSIFVDHQGGTVPQVVEALKAAGVPVLMVVDHHEPQNLLEPEFGDIRQAGATATIYCGYLQDGILEMDSARREHVLAATALMHGILSDTGGFIRAGGEDFRAAAFLARLRDAEILEQIMTQARSKHAMDIIQRALGNRVTQENYSIAGIGYVRAEDRDAIPQAADFLLTEENVHTAIVYGILKDERQEERVVGSLRTAKFTLDPDEFIKEVLGRSVEGQYFGGGRDSAGGFSIPVGFLSGDYGPELQETKWKMYDAQIKHRLFAKIGVEPVKVEL